MSNNQTTEKKNSTVPEIHGPIEGHKLEIGGGFNALSFKENDFRGMMDPLIMVDHFTMTEPTFGAHAHAGISAVTVLFEDSQGHFVNRDSLGKHIKLEAGDVYWMVAASGAIHDEAPEEGASTHGLQIFVNLPSRMKHDEPHSRHVQAAEIPVIEKEDRRLRVVLGETNGIKGPQSPSLPFMLIDGKLNKEAVFSHTLPNHDSAWVHSAKGDIEVTLNGRKSIVKEGGALGLRATGDHSSLAITAHSDSHFVLISATPLHEPFVKKGPFVMSTDEDIQQVEEDYKNGKLGQIA